MPSADAVRALVALGFPAAAAEIAIRGILDRDGPQDTAALVRRALSELART
jgi:Holliday junction resolvasome RuvABC DNA-binding subunit